MLLSRILPVRLREQPEPSYTKVLTSTLNTLIDSLNLSILEQGTGVPATAPTRLGALYLNTSAGDFYLAAGTAAAGDWKKIT